jgi:hypothetical protein
VAASNIEHAHVNRDFETQAVSLEREAKEIVAGELVDLAGLEEWNEIAFVVRVNVLVFLEEETLSDGVGIWIRQSCRLVVFLEAVEDRATGG